MQAIYYFIQLLVLNETNWTAYEINGVYWLVWNFAELRELTFIKLTLNVVSPYRMAPEVAITETFKDDPYDYKVECDKIIDEPWVNFLKFLLFNITNLLEVNSHRILK